MIWFLVPVMRNARNFDEGIILCVSLRSTYETRLIRRGLKINYNTSIRQY